LVNETGISIHHVVNATRFFPVAFIFDEWPCSMVNRWFALARPNREAQFRA
jgi:hypothetical protein